jgi:hypothetical protein
VAPALLVAVSSAPANGVGASSSRINSALRRRRRAWAGPGGGKIGLDLFQHPRQRDGEREEGSV